MDRPLLGRVHGVRAVHRAAAVPRRRDAGGDPDAPRHAPDPAGHVDRAGRRPADLGLGRAAGGQGRRRSGRGPRRQAWDEFEEIAIALLGPRWRRDARLQAAAGDAEPEYRTYTEGEPPVPATARPYTPPPPDLPPGPLAPPPADDAAGRRRRRPAPRGRRRRPPRRRRPTSRPARSRRPPSRPSRRAGRAVGLLLAAAAALLVVVAVVAFLATRGERGAGRTRRRDAQAAVIPEGNLIANPSFEENTDGWGPFQATLAREPADDAPDGEYVARVTLDVEPERVLDRRRPRRPRDGGRGRTPSTSPPPG